MLGVEAEKSFGVFFLSGKSFIKMTESEAFTVTLALWGLYCLMSLFVTWVIGPCILSKFADDAELGEMADSPDGYAAIQRDLDGLEKWENRTARKFSKRKCKVLHLGRDKPVLGTGWKAALLKSGQVEGELVMCPGGKGGQQHPGSKD